LQLLDELIILFTTSHW